MLDRILKTVVVLSLVTCSLVTSCEIGQNSVKIEPSSDYIVINDNINSYRIKDDCSYCIKRVKDVDGVAYLIYITSTDGDLMIEYTDQLIDGDLVTAEEWVESFKMIMEGI